MDQDQKLNAILEAVTKNSAKLEAVETRIGGIETSIVGMQASIEGNQTAIEETREILEFLKDNMVMKQEFDEKVTELKNEIVMHVDGFTVLQKYSDAELTALRAKSDRMQGHIQQLADHQHVQLQY